MTKPRARYRIGAVEEMTGLTRDAIHMYVRDKLVPPPERASKTTAWFTLEHVRILRVIRVLREHGIPLPVIERLIASKKALLKLSVARLARLGASLRAAGVREIRRGTTASEAVLTTASKLGVRDRLSGNAALVDALELLAQRVEPQWTAVVAEVILPAIYEQIERSSHAELLAVKDALLPVLGELTLERVVDILVDRSVRGDR
jgi:DNA-binding transcriptional MerR regulator